MAYEALKDRKKAEAFYASAASGDDGNQPEIRYYRAMALKKLNRQPEADKILEDIIATAQKQLNTPEEIDYFSKFGNGETRALRDAKAHYALGLALLGKGEREQANGEFRKSLALSPGHVPGDRPADGAHRGGLVRVEPAPAVNLARS